MNSNSGTVYKANQLLQFAMLPFLFSFSARMLMLAADSKVFLRVRNLGCCSFVDGTPDRKKLE